MSDAPEKKETDLDLDLHFLPAWARHSPDQNRYANYEGREERRRDFGPRDPSRRHDRPPQRERPPRDRQQRPPRPEAKAGQPGRPGQPPRPEGRRPGFDRGRGPDRRRPAPLPQPPQLELNVAYVPEEKGVDSLARQIRMTGRAYPLFDIAQLVLAKPERYSVTVSVKKKPDGSVAQPLYLCAIDDTLWLSEEEAVRWALEKHFDLFYQADRTQIEPPKGTYTFVAQCGMSGVILGPPNYHDYQNNLRKLHQDRFSRMPFDVYKSRVKIVRDEAVVKQWLDEQSWKTEYIALNLPEPLRLGSREEVEKHFRENHLPNIIKSVETHRLSGVSARNVCSPLLARLLRFGVEEQKRFPLQMATILSQQFAARALQFFKVNKTVTHVAVSRPHFLDLDAVPVSEGVRNIVTFINAHPRCTRRDLVEALAPTPAAVPTAGAAITPPAETAAAADLPSPPPAPPPPSPQQTAIISDLHWLVHQGHVIEFANGTLETAKKPAPKPVRPAPPAPAAPEAESPKPEETAAAQVDQAAADSQEAPPAEVTESSPPPASETPEYSADSRTEIEVSAGGEADAVESNEKQNA